MNSIYNSAYEDDIEKLIQTFGNKLVSDAIRWSINDLYSNNTSTLYNEPQIIKNRITRHERKLRIKPSDLRGIVKDCIVYNLDNNETRDRAEIVFKFLCRFYFGERKLSFEIISERISQIKSGSQFPPHDDSGKKEGKDDGMYKALGNLFLNDTIESNEHTLKFGIAILGLKIKKLEEVLLKLGEVRKNTDDESEPPPIIIKKPTPKNHKLYTGLIIGVVLSFAITVRYYFPENKNFQSEVIESNDLFGRPFDLNDDIVFADSLIIETMSITYNEMVVENENAVGLNRLWIRFRVLNLSRSPYFPDEIFLKQINSFKMNGEVAHKSTAIESISSNIIFEFPKKTNYPIINSDVFPSIPPRSQVFGLIEVMSNNELTPMIFEFKMGMNLHYNSEDLVIETHDSFKIAFESSI